MSFEPFQVLCAATFDVLPVRQGEIYDILEVSKDGSRWKARDSEGRIGWIPAKYCQVLEEVVEEEAEVAQPKKPAVSSLSEQLLSFLDNCEVAEDGGIILYMDEEQKKPVQQASYREQDFTNDNNIKWVQRQQVQIPTYDLYKPSTSPSSQIHMRQWNSATGELTGPPSAPSPAPTPEPEPAFIPRPDLSAQNPLECSASRKKQNIGPPKKKIMGKKYEASSLGLTGYQGRRS